MSISLNSDILCMFMELGEIAIERLVITNQKQICISRISLLKLNEKKIVNEKQTPTTRSKTFSR